MKFYTFIALTHYKEWDHKHNYKVWNKNYKLVLTSRGVGPNKRFHAQMAIKSNYQNLSFYCEKASHIFFHIIFLLSSSLHKSLDNSELKVDV